jgi:hypothetical protein
MLPVAFGHGDGSEWRNPMGIVAIGGLATSTGLTLLVVPVVYTMIDDAETALARRWRRLRGRPEPLRAVKPDDATPLRRASGDSSDSGGGI